MDSFDWKLILKTIKDGLIITVTMTGNLKLAGGIVGGVPVKDYAVYKKWINE